MKSTDIIKSLVMEEGLSQSEIIERFAELKKDKKITSTFEIYKRQVQKTILNLKKKGIYEEAQVYSDEEEFELEYTSKLGASTQKGRDNLREVRKENRENYRLFNALESFNIDLAKTLKEFNMGKTSKDHKPVSSDYVPVVHLSDLHFGEVINLPSNKYNYEVASKRLALFADHIKRSCKMYNCKEVVLAFTGDMVNATHVLSKIVLNSETQARIVTQATYILKEFILDLNKEMNVSIATIVGNESRIIMKSFDNFQNSDSDLATNSFDYILFNMLKLSLEGSPGISFIGGNFLEKVISVNGQNILMTHGTEIPAANPSNKIHKLIAFYATKGIIIDYVLFGHIHSPQATDSYSRSGGLPGANGYSESKALIGRASQSIIFFGTKGDRQTLLVDLQNVEGVTGYEILDIEDNLNLLEAKRSGKVILEVIV